MAEHGSADGVKQIPLTFDIFDIFDLNGGLFNPVVGLPGVSWKITSGLRLFDKISNNAT